MTSLSCDRGDRVWQLSYRVEILSGKGVYSVKYIDGNGADVQEGNLSDNWRSATYSQVESGHAARLEVLQVSGTMSFRLEILRDGAVHESRESTPGETAILISDIL